MKSWRMMVGLAVLLRCIHISGCCDVCSEVMLVSMLMHGASKHDFLGAVCFFPRIIECHPSFWGDRTWCKCMVYNLILYFFTYFWWISLIKSAWFGLVLFLWHLLEIKDPWSSGRLGTDFTNENAKSSSLQSWEGSVFSVCFCCWNRPL